VNSTHSVERNIKKRTMFYYRPLAVDENGVTIMGMKGDKIKIILQ